MFRRIVLSLVFFLVSGVVANAAQQDVTSSLTISPTGFLLNRTTGTFDSKVTLTNKSSTTFGAPLWLVISGLPSGSSLANASGVTPSGIPYILVPLANDKLTPTDSVSQAVRINNPNRVSLKPTFSVQAQPLATVPNVIGLTQTSAGTTLNQLNLALGGVTSLNSPTVLAGNIIDQIPKAGTVVASGSTVSILVSLGPPPSGYQLGIVSSPPTVAVVGKLIQYQVDATSSNPSTLSYSLTNAPSGMTIDATTGRVMWTPSSTQTGDQSTTITAQDISGQVSQNFTLSVFGATPVTTAFISAQTGGTITVNNPGSNINGLTITIPPGALSANTTFTVSGLIAPQTLGGEKHFLMKGFMVEPDGTALSIPATVTIPYSTSEFDTSEGIPLEDFLGVNYVNTATGELIGMTNFSVDKVNHQLTGTVPHFSVYFGTNIARLCPPPTAADICPNTYTSSAANNLPAVMVHGFQLKFLRLVSMGNESTWGQLRYMLKDLDNGGSNRIDAWRFDWDTKSATFESSAGRLSKAIAVVRNMSNQSTVNLVAHSFGGILVRTYLEGMASSGPYNYDVNRVLTVGSPHQGIGGNFSNPFANKCAWDSVNRALSFVQNTWLASNLYYETCHEAATGIGNGNLFGEGNFLRQLNHVAGFPFAYKLPLLFSSHSPQYKFIIGDKSQPGSPLSGDDGLITTVGASLCAVDPYDCSSLVTEETIQGLCHSGALIGKSCNSTTSIAMVEVNDQGHPLWHEICDFLNDTGNSSLCATPTPTGRLNDTGITASQCYQAGSNTLVACSSAGAIALSNAQDGMTGRDANAATNSNTDGKLGFSFAAVTGGCVQDNVTGLTWEVKTTDGGLRDWNKTYTNYSATYNPSNLYGSATDASGFVTAVNATSLCGHNDWRLPTADELQSIVDYGVAYPGPTVDVTWFPNTRGHLFWSASPFVGYAYYAWGVDFGDGSVHYFGDRRFTYYVRLVRAGQ